MRDSKAMRASSRYYVFAFNVATILFSGRKKPCGEIIKIDNGIRATAYWPGVSSNASSLDVIRNACETR